MSLLPKVSVSQETRAISSSLETYMLKMTGYDEDMYGVVTVCWVTLNTCKDNICCLTGTLWHDLSPNKALVSSSIFVTSCYSAACDIDRSVLLLLLHTSLCEIRLINVRMS